mgnify:FL=1
MAWLYNNKQVYKAWTDAESTTHPATWDADWSDAEKYAKGLTQGDASSRFYNADASKKTVATIKSEEGARMDGLKATVLSQTHYLTINESDGEPVDTIPSATATARNKTTAAHAEAKNLINAKTTFDQLWDLIMRSDKAVLGIPVPSASGDWGTDDWQTIALYSTPPNGFITRFAKQNEFITE